MYQSAFLSALLLTVGLQRYAQAQFAGAITHVGPETDGILMVMIENNSTGNYSIEARNNLFDDANPYQPIVIQTLAGKRLTLVGTQAPYGQLTDSAFLTMPPGAIWQRTLNMTEYIPPDATATKSYSECFTASFPDGIFAVNTTDFQPDEDLATGFLKGDSVQIFIEAPPLHLNITVQAGAAAAAVESTATVGTQAAATLILGTATAVGHGGAAPTLGSSIDTYTNDATAIFAAKDEKEEEPVT